jgi:hypothetical protein
MKKMEKRKRKTWIALLSPLTRVLAHTSRIPLWLTGGAHLSGLSSPYIVVGIPSTAPLDLWPCPLASPCTANHPHSHPHSLSGKPTPTVVSSTQASPPSPLPVALRRGIKTPPTLLCLPFGPYKNLWPILSPLHLLALSLVGMTIGRVVHEYIIRESIPARQNSTHTRTYKRSWV